ncbi:MAG: response regulator [Acidobacteria bacterium]|nr:response regulator [Acidobacteriota bacterium]
MIIKIREKWIRIKSVQVLWETKPALLHFLTDITELKKIEEECKMLTDQLLHSRKMEAIGSLAGGIAHDFNNILGAIHGYTELAVNELEKGNHVRVNLEYVLSAAGRAKELVRQILAFSRKADEEKKIIYLSHIINEALRLLRSSLPTTIELRTRIEERLTPIMADPTRMLQVIMNLCANAGYAMRENGGILEIALEEIVLNTNLIDMKELEPGKYQRLLISDTGYGMDIETKKKIFEPYFTTKKEGEGTGMGLSLVQGIVKSHNGEIIVESEPGKGTSFYIYLPVSDIMEEPVVESLKPIQGGNERILLVDDEWTLVEMGKQMLERFGYSVDIKTSSPGALEVFSADPTAYDLIITDQTMPVMTGIQLSQEIRQIRPDIPVILCTGFSEIIDEENFKSRGIDAFIMKPIVMREIAAIIRQVLDKKCCE